MSGSPTPVDPAPWSAWEPRLRALSDGIGEATRRALADAAVPAEDRDHDYDIPADWAWSNHTRSKRAVLVGGEPREATRAHLERAFGFSAVRWTDADVARRLILAGDADILVVFGQRVPDRVEQAVLPVARSRNVAFVHVDHGSSAALVKSAIERFTEREGEATL